MRNLFKVNNTDTRTLNRFHTLFWCFYCWLWKSKCWLGKTMINFSELKIKTLHHLASPLPLTLNNNLQYLVKVNKREIKTIGPYFVLVLLWLILNWYFKDAYFLLVLLWLTLNRYFKAIFRTLNTLLYSFARISLNVYLPCRPWASDWTNFLQYNYNTNIALWQQTADKKI